jgi:hypothetical protein
MPGANRRAQAIGKATRVEFDGRLKREPQSHSPCFAQMAATSASGETSPRRA